MTIDITDRERQLLYEMFAAAEKELITGIDHADTRDFRQRLQDRLRLLEHLHAKLVTGQASGGSVH